jgi:serine/threonine protein kinase
MASLDAVTLGSMAVRLGLLTPQQLQEAWDELGSKSIPGDDFLRCCERKGFMTPFQTTKLGKGEMDGYFLGGFRILYKIASGSFGRVYRADDPSNRRMVALKVLRKKWSEDKHKIELFEREGKMGMTLRHPNIVETLAVSHDKKTNQHYIVMEFVEGGNLRDFLNIRKKLPVTDVLRILEDTASGLAYALAKGITHRDMKLTNILLSSQGQGKLVDFGLAGAQQLGQDEKDKDKDDVSVDRTVDYAGLEKASNAPKDDPRSDLFFVGCIAYELLTGRSPLDMTRSAQARMAAERFTRIPPMKAEEVQAPPAVFRLVENLMILQPEYRIQTPSQLLERVKECRAESSGDASQKKEAKKSQFTIFLVESQESLQDVLRSKLKEQGFRVLIAADPVRALERFRQQPFDLLIVNASTTGENGLHSFERIIEDAHRQNIPSCGILMLDAEQREWEAKLANKPGVAVLVQPIKYKQLLRTIQSLLGINPTQA